MLQTFSFATNTLIEMLTSLTASSNSRRFVPSYARHRSDAALFHRLHELLLSGIAALLRFPEFCSQLGSDLDSWSIALVKWMRGLAYQNHFLALSVLRWRQRTRQRYHAWQAAAAKRKNDTYIYAVHHWSLPQDRRTSGPTSGPFAQTWTRLRTPSVFWSKWSSITQQWYRRLRACIRATYMYNLSALGTNTNSSFLDFINIRSTSVQINSQSFAILPFCILRV